MSTCETTSKLGMAAMLGRLGSVSERPKETVCKTVAEATMVRTHPGPLKANACKGPGPHLDAARAFHFATRRPLTTARRCSRVGERRDRPGTTRGGGRPG